MLNISFDATSSLQLGNDFIEFKARFGGKPRDILVPVGRVIAIYARENGQGMAFSPPVDSSVAAPSSSAVLAPVADVVESGVLLRIALFSWFRPLMRVMMNRLSPPLGLRAAVLHSNG